MLFVLSSALPDRADDYRRWYLTHHLNDMTAVPGVGGGAFYAMPSPDAQHGWAFGAEYPIDRPVDDILPVTIARVQSGEMTMTDAIDPATVLMLAAHAIGPGLGSEQAGDTPKALFVTMSNAVAGQEDAFNAWYDDRHLHDVMAVPGVRSARRYRLDPQTAGKPSPWTYLARYEIALADLERTMAELFARGGTDRMPISPAMADGGFAGLFVPCSA